MVFKHCGGSVISSVGFSVGASVGFCVTVSATTDELSTGCAFVFPHEHSVNGAIIAKNKAFFIKSLLFHP
jgi:hypothetical protein